MRERKRSARREPGAARHVSASPTWTRFGSGKVRTRRQATFELEVVNPRTRCHVANRRVIIASTSSIARQDSCRRATPALVIYSWRLSDRNKSPFLSPSPGAILAEWLPNCIALFFLWLASTRPSFRAASRNSSFSPTPTSKRGSVLRCTGSCARKLTTESDRNGCLVSLPQDEITRSSLPRFLVGMRSISS